MLFQLIQKVNITEGIYENKRYVLFWCFKLMNSYPQLEQRVAKQNKALRHILYK